MIFAMKLGVANMGAQTGQSIRNAPTASTRPGSRPVAAGSRCSVIEDVGRQGVGHVPRSDLLCGSGGTAPPPVSVSG
jgi:hypothetical protein